MQDLKVGDRVIISKEFNRLIGWNNVFNYKVYTVIAIINEFRCRINTKKDTGKNSIVLNNRLILAKEKQMQFSFMKE